MTASVRGGRHRNKTSLWVWTLDAVMRRKSGAHQGAVGREGLFGEYIDSRDATMPFELWAPKYLEKKLRLRLRTKEKYESSLRIHLLPAFRGAPIGRITRDDVQAWVMDVHDRGFEPETIRGHYDLLNAMMKRAVEGGLIVRSPCRSIELRAVIAHEKRYLTEDEVERLVAAVEPRYKALI